MEVRGFDTLANSLDDDGSVTVIPIDVTGRLLLELSWRWVSYRCSGSITVTRTRGLRTTTRTYDLGRIRSTEGDGVKLGWEVKANDTITVSMPNDSGADATLAEAELTLDITVLALAASTVVGDDRADLIWHFDANDVTDGGRFGTQPADGGTLNEWADLADYEVDFSEAIGSLGGYAAAPKWHEGGGIPYVRFARIDGDSGAALTQHDKNSSTENNLNPAIQVGATAGTYVAVVRSENDPQPSYSRSYAEPVNFITGYSIFSSGEGLYPNSSGVASVHFGSNDGGRSLGDLSQDLTEAHVLVVSFDEDGNWECWINGTSVQAVTGNNVPVWGGDASSNPVHMAYGQGQLRIWGGDIFEWRLYGVDKTDQEIAAITDFLAQKWGL